MIRLFTCFGLFFLLVLALGCGGTPGEKTVELFVPEQETLTRGGEEGVLITIARHNFELPVKVTISNLPDGVTVKDSEQNEIVYAADDNEATFTLSAAITAETGDHTATVTADVEGMSPVTETFKLTVAE